MHVFTSHLARSFIHILANQNTTIAYNNEHSLATTLSCTILLCSAGLHCARCTMHTFSISIDTLHIIYRILSISTTLFSLKFNALRKALIKNGIRKRTFRNHEKSVRKPRRKLSELKSQNTKCQMHHQNPAGKMKNYMLSCKSGRFFLFLIS